MMQTREEKDSLPVESYREPLPLYLARFKGSVWVNEISVPVQADILVAGKQAEDQTFWVYEIRRFALRSGPLDELGGPLSLAGPAGDVDVEPGPAGTVRCVTRLYYQALNELEPAYTEHDAIFPRVEKLGGNLAWEWEAAKEEGPVKMHISLTLDEMVDAPLGKVRKVDLTPTEALTFRSLREGGIVEESSHSLEECGSTAPEGGAYDCRALHIRVVSVSELETADALEPWVKEWIDSACRVWWEKGGIKIVPHPDIDEHDYPTGEEDTLGEIPLGKEGGIILPPDEGGAGCDPDRIDIYLADYLDPSYWGGVTFGAGTDDAYILLEIGQAKHNKFLLAHELGHVLGLAHPDVQGEDIWTGSYCSVMLPERPISSRNTASNLNVVEGLSPPLGPVVFEALLQDTDRAPDSEQGFFHIIRDFPYDDGAATSVPELPFTDWWTHSDVWNSDQEPTILSGLDEFQPIHYADGSAMFEPEHSPIHTEPSCSGPNWMYVRLHTCQPLTEVPDPEVRVYLYLAVPGASSEPLSSLPMIGVATPYLAFSGLSQPLPSFPRTRWVQ
jgi:hypothetical protein